MAKLLETIRQELDEGVKHEFHVWDNGGKTADRYTVIHHHDMAEHKKTGKAVDALGLDDQPTHPQGFSQSTTAIPGKHLGKKIPFHKLPKHVQDHVKHRYGVNEEVVMEGDLNEVTQWKSNGELMVEVSERDLMNRPDLHAAREHFKTAIHHSREHSKLVKHALEKHGDGNGVQISGIVRDHFPEHVKEKLRHHARSVTHHNDLGMQAKPKGVRHSTMVQLGQAVAKHHGPTGFYGFHPRNEDTDLDLDAIYDSEVLTEDHDGHGAHELVMHADNDSHLYHSSHIPVVKNLERKYRKGIYDPEKAKKLWKYHADRAAQSYHKEHGDPHSKWHHAFSPATRHEAAAHWEKHHRAEMEAGNFHDH